MLVTFFVIVAIAEFYVAADALHQQTMENSAQSLLGNQSRIVCEKIRGNDQALREIKKLPEFLEECLKKSVVEYTLKPLTQPGDNYNSVLQSLEVKLIKNNDSSEIETLQLVCKRTPGGLISASHSKQFSNEMHFYSDIIPAIEKFEEAMNIPNTERIDAFVRYFGSRLSLDHNAENADTDAVTLLENIKSQKYISLDRRGKFNRDEMLAVLKRLAKLHALIIAIRRLQPHIFYSKIDPHLHTRYNNSYMESLIKIADKFAKNLPIAFPNMTLEMQARIENQLNFCKEYLIRSEITSAADTPYTTIYHRDLWTKNIMIKKVAVEESSIEVKILDFQAYDYESFAFDLTFSILYNVEIEDLDFKSFIEYYHSEFVKVMRLVNCPLEDYTYEKMWHEIKEKTKVNLLKLYLYLAFDQIEMLKNDSIPASNIEFYLEKSPPKAILNQWKCINDVYFENGFI